MSSFTWLNDYSKDDLDSHEVHASGKLLDFLKKESIDVEDFADSATLIHSKIVNNIVEELRYQGFDLDEIKATFMKRAVLLFPDLKSQDSTTKEKARVAMLSELTQLMCFLSCRSSNLEKIEDLRSAKEDMRKLFAKWGIKTRLEQSERVTGLTLPRLAIANPSIYLRCLYLSGNIYRFGRIKGMEPIYHSNIGAAIIPRNEWGLTQIKLWSNWAKGFSRQINSSRPANQQQSSFEQTSQLSKLQYETGYTHVERLFILLEFYANIAVSNSTTYERIFVDSEMLNMSFMSSICSEIISLLPDKKDEVTKLKERIENRQQKLSPSQQPRVIPPRAPTAAQTVKK